MSALAPAGPGPGGRSELLEAILAAPRALSAADPDAYRTSDAMGLACIDVPAMDWLAVMTAAKCAGGRLDWLGAVDVTEEDPGSSSADVGAVGVGGVEVIAGIREGATEVLIRTRLGAGVGLASITGIFPGAQWHEREAAEMLGLHFIGGDSRPLLLARPSTVHPEAQVDAEAEVVAGESPGGSHAQTPPLRRSFPLAARLTTPWPGAAGARRRSRVPGNNPRWAEAEE